MTNKTDNPLRPSNLNRAFHCPPSVWRSQGMPEIDNDAAKEGRLIHELIVLAYHEKPYTATAEQQIVVNSCLRFLKDQLEEGDGKLLERELSVGGYRIGMLAHLDVLILKADGTAVLIDWKTGRAEPEYPAAIDLQLWSYALAAHNWYGVKKVTCYRYHPRLYDENRESSVVFEGDLEQWAKYEWAVQNVIAKSTPEAQAIAGNHCIYCPAKIKCPEFLAYSEMDLIKVDENLPVASLFKVLDARPKVNLLKTMVKDAENIARRLPEDDLKAAGYGLKEGKKRRSIISVGEVRKQLEVTIPQEAYVKISVTDLEKAVKSISGLKGKEASDHFEDLFGDLIEVKRDRPSVVKIKKGDSGG